MEEPQKISQMISQMVLAKMAGVALTEGPIEGGDADIITSFSEEPNPYNPHGVQVVASIQFPPIEHIFITSLDEVEDRLMVNNPHDDILEVWVSVFVGFHHSIAMRTEVYKVYLKKNKENIGEVVDAVREITEMKLDRLRMEDKVWQE